MLSIFRNSWAQPWRATGLWITALILIGLVLRLRQFVFNRSLWLDEAYLAASFVDRSLGELILEPLSNNQAAPLGFIVLVKWLTEFLGVHDWVLRLLPFTAGALTLWAGSALARTVFSSKLPQTVLVGLLALSPVLVYYSSEFKQYQIDVLVTVWLLWLALRFNVEHWQRDTAVLALAGALVIWFSHASLFVLAAAGIVLWLETMRHRHGTAWLAVSGMGLLWLASFAINHLLTLRNLTGNQNLLGFWYFAYAPLPPTSLAEWRWYLESALGLVYLAVRHVGVAHHGVEPAWFDGLNFLLLALSLVGVMALLRLSPRAAAIGLAMVTVVLLASALHLYPFRSRLILFLVPLVHIALAAVVQAVRDNSRLHAAGSMAVLLSVLLLLVPAEASWKVMRKPHNDQDIKSALELVTSRIQPGDGFVLDSMTHKAYDHYVRKFGLNNTPLTIFRPTINQRHDALATVRRLCTEWPMQRSWVIITHRQGDRMDYLSHLSSVSPPIGQWTHSGAVTRLYDFRSSAYCQRYATPTQGKPPPPS